MTIKELAMVLTLTFAEKTRRLNCAIDLTIQANQRIIQSNNVCTSTEVGCSVFPLQYILFQLKSMQGADVSILIVYGTSLTHDA